MSELMLIVNIITIILLTAALLYSMRLSKRIDAFMKSREDLTAVFRMFDDTISQAQKHSAELREEAETAMKDLQKASDDARLMLQDLRTTCVRAEKVYDKAERGVLSLIRNNGAAVRESAESIAERLKRSAPAAEEEQPAKEEPLTAAPAVPALSPEEKKKKQAALEEMLKHASRLRRKNAAAQTEATPAPKKPAPAAARPKTADNDENGIDDAGEAIKRALKAMGVNEDGAPAKKRTKKA